MINLNPDIGQVLTPDAVAEKMIKRSLAYLKNKNLSILDPAIGPASFLKAINKLKINVKNFLISHHSPSRSDKEIKKLENLLHNNNVKFASENEVMEF